MAARQDKATMEKNSKTLRELVKLPQNKVCADCKRNDPRWASWNIGVFVCIRCSGIHRSMGTHISKVKSVDLDVWTPEQMASIQKWGNARANLYWEAHLKSGHIPPDHKMDSFIRSKYESRRWALEGPPPADPSVLDRTEDEVNSVQPETVAATTVGQSSSQSSAVAAPVQTIATAARISTTTKPNHSLISSSHTRTPSIPPASTPSQPTNTTNDLFSLDFSAPSNIAPASNTLTEKKDTKQDILSLYSTQHSSQSNAFGNPTSLFSAPAPTQQPQSMIGNGGPGFWGTDSWSSPSVSTQTGSANVWASPSQQQPPSASSQSIWGAPVSAPAANDPFASFSNKTPAPKQNDAFSDLWGGF